MQSGGQPVLMQRGGRVLMCPPMHEEIDEWGYPVYRVVFRHGGSELIGFLDPHPLPREEAHERIREELRSGLRDGTYQESQFYTQDPNGMYVPQLPQYYGGLQEERDAAHGHGCFGGVPASGEAILGLQERSMEEGECSVCLMDFEAGSKVRMMPCSHCFHEQCIFSWLQLSHICPLCRFALPTEQK